MPVAAVINPAYGFMLRTGSGSPGAYTYSHLTQITDFDGPGREVGTRSTVNLDSVADTCDVTLFKGGECSGTLQYDPQSDAQQVLEGLLSTPKLAPWQILWGDVTNGGTSGAGGTTFTFMGVFTKFAPTGVKREENLLASFGIKVSGLVTVAKGT